MSGRGALFGALFGALAAFAVSFAAYALLLQGVTYGDGILYLDLARKGELYSHHHLYLPGMVSFTRLAELLGVADRTAGFLFSAFAAAAGNACLWLAVARRVARPAGAAALVFLASTAPVLLFFATTAENHAQHYGWVCLALLLADRAFADPRLPRVLLAGVGLACVPASHLTGFLLLPGLTLLAWSELGRAPVFARWQPARFGRIAVFLAPLGAYVALFHLTTWFRVHVLELPPHLLASAVGFEMERRILADRGGGIADTLGFLGEEAAWPVIGAAIVLVIATPRLLREAPRLGAIALAAILPYAILVPMHGIPERGAYVIALVAWIPYALSFLENALPRVVLAACVVLGAGQGVVGLVQLSRFPSREPADSPSHAGRWAADAMRLDAGVPGKDRLYLCADLWRTTHLRYDFGADAVQLPRMVQQFRGDLNTLLGVYVQKLPVYLQRGPVYVSEEAWAELPELWPELRQLLEHAYRTAPVRAASFRGLRVLPKE